MDHQWQVTDVVILTCAPDRTYVFSPKRYAENKHRTYLVKVKATIVSRRYTTCLFTPVRKTQTRHAVYVQIQQWGAFVQPLLNWKSSKNHIF